ncbi:DUF2336 domain-containing protein [Oceanicaulis sp. MMSF_3324]|uniref:DUF2336 domain-containing protein n=1 Tax=Oceanicaulis sp. MMSF_3324 TaxID=3046702 RepID=UPI00273D408B|nr:DUF2336 domain-containing protein [Oceanicaulis sp. MMSF_3324]
MTVQTLRARLTRDDIQRLSNATDTEGRALAARKFCARFASVDLSEDERAIGSEVVRLLADDAAEMVRRSLSVTLQRSTHLPSDVARKLAEDVDSIALPVIAGSPVLSDEDLVQIVRSSSSRRQAAVAARASVSESVVHEIVEVGDREAVKILASNNGARFDERGYASTLNRFDGDADVLDQFVLRDALPVNITEKLIAHISDQAMQKLVNRHALPAQLAVELAEGARERATVDLVEQAGLSDEPRRFVQQLQLNGRLTPSLILRSLFRGHMSFFEHCMAELSGLGHEKAWLLVHDAGNLGLETLFKRAGMPARILPVARAAVSAWHSLEIGPNGTPDIVRFRRLLAERILTQFQGVPQAELDYIMDRLDADETELNRTAMAVAS